MKTVNDLAICLQQRGVSMTEAAKAVGISRINFYTTYAHVPVAKNTEPWKRVRRILHRQFGIGYDNANGWHLLSDDEMTRGIEPDEFEKMQALHMLERINRKAAEKRGEKHE